MPALVFASGNWPYGNENNLWSFRSTRILSISFETAHRISRLSTTILAIQPGAAGVIGVESGRSAGSTGLNLISRTLYPGSQNVHHIPITVSHFMLNVSVHRPVGVNSSF